MINEQWAISVPEITCTIPADECWEMRFIYDCCIYDNVWNKILF